MCSVDQPNNLETQCTIGCCGHVTTVQTRGLFIFTLATALSEGCSMWTALCSQLCWLPDANRWQRHDN